MDSNLLAAMIGLAGGLVGVAIGAMLQQRTTHRQMCRETTLQLYARFDDPHILESRIRADRILAANACAPEPQCFSELLCTLPRDDWHHVSRTRHFLDQIGLLRRIGYLDNTIAAPLFASYVEYWVDRYFLALEQAEAEYAKRTGKRPQQWRVPSAELKQLFVPQS
jgi:hypothetical protein